MLKVVVRKETARLWVNRGKRQWTCESGIPLPTRATITWLGGIPETDATTAYFLRPRSSGKNERVAPVLQTFVPFPKMSKRQCFHAIGVRKTSGMMESWNRAYQDSSTQGWEWSNSSNGILWVVFTCVVKENVSLISMFYIMKPLMVRSIKIFVC
jgi:hypothetical protein